MTKEELYSYWRKYRQQKDDAADRGIAFLLTFDEWLALWVASGHLHERGKRKGQYQMGRFGDQGPYAVGNVEIVTVEQNRAAQVLTKEHCSRPGSKNGNAKFTEKDILDIRRAHKDDTAIKDLAKSYRTSRQIIWGIVKRKTWTHVQ